MKALALRKQLLLAESELNRAQLTNEWQAMAGTAHALAARVKGFGAIAAAVATLVAGWSACARKKTAPAAEKPSWWQTVLQGAGLFSTICQAFRSASGDLKK